MRIGLPGACATLLLIGGCSSERPAGSPEPDASTSLDGGADASFDAAVDLSDASDASPPSCDEKAKACASQFGSLFTESNGRADGTLVAIVRPVDQQCAQPNAAHVTLQLSILGQVQRLVVSVEDVAVASVEKPLIGPPFSEGWHLDQHLEYAPDLGVHSDDFTQVTLEGAVDFVCSHLEIGDPVSVFAYSDGSKPSSAHQIHSNDNYPDGAIVANPTSASPTYLLFRFANQVF